MLRDLSKLKYVGEGVAIGDYVKIVRPEMVEIHDRTRIDDFTVIVPGEGGVRIGRYVHIASFCSISGGGQLVMEDFSTLSAGVRIFTGSDDYHGNSMTNPCVPKQFVKPIISHVTIGKHVVIGASTVILPGVNIATGVAVGASSLVRHDLPEWTVCWGIPCKPAKERRRDIILAMEQELIQKYHAGVF